MTDATAIQIVTPEERAAREREGQGLVVAANEISIDSSDAYTKAAKWLQERVLPLKKQISETFRPRITQAHELHKGLLADEKRFLAPVEGAERVVRGKIAAYEEQQRQRQREAEETARRERQRLEDEERARVDAERRRLEDEARQARLAQVEQAVETRDQETADRLIAAPLEVAPVAPRPVFAPPAAIVTAPKVEGLAFQEVWEFEVVDEAAVPREYLDVSETRIRKVVQALREKTKIPGVRAFSRRVPKVKG